VPLPAGQHRTDGRLYVGSVAADIDLEALGLLDGLEGEARTERAELIAWLLDRGFSIDQIRASVAPLLLPANRVMGEDGVYLSAREICEETGLDLPLLQRLQGAVGLPRIEDPDAAVLPRVDGEAVAHAKIFLDMGVDPDETVAVMRVLMEGLQHAAAMMRRAAFRTLMRPGASEIDLAGASEALARQAVPQVGPMVQDLLLLELRHTFETEAVNAAERAAGVAERTDEPSATEASFVGRRRTMVPRCTGIRFDGCVCPSLERSARDGGAEVLTSWNVWYKIADTWNKRSRMVPKSATSMEQRCPESIDRSRRSTTSTSSRGSRISTSARRAPTFAR